MRSSKAFGTTAALLELKLETSEMYHIRQMEMIDPMRRSSESVIMSSLWMVVALLNGLPKGPDMVLRKSD